MNDGCATRNFHTTYFRLVNCKTVAMWLEPKKCGYRPCPKSWTISGGFANYLTISNHAPINTALILFQLSYKISTSRRFWSQLIYDKNTLNGVNSFLHLAPLQKLYHKTDDEDISAVYKRIKKAVFQLLKRISRLKESEVSVPILKWLFPYIVLNSNSIIFFSVTFLERNQISGDNERNQSNARFSIILHLHDLWET